MKNIRVFYLIFFQFLEVKFSIYLNRRVFVMCSKDSSIYNIENSCLSLYLSTFGTSWAKLAYRNFYFSCQADDSHEMSILTFSEQ